MKKVKHFYEKSSTFMIKVDSEKCIIVRLCTMYIHIGCTLSPKKEVGVGEEESSGIGEVEVVVREMYTGHAPVYISRNK